MSAVLRRKYPGTQLRCRTCKNSGGPNRVSKTIWRTYTKILNEHYVFISPTRMAAVFRRVTNVPSACVTEPPRARKTADELYGTGELAAATSALRPRTSGSPRRTHHTQLTGRYDVLTSYKYLTRVIIYARIVRCHVSCVQGVPRAFDRLRPCRVTTLFLRR